MSKEQQEEKLCKYSKQGKCDCHHATKYGEKCIWNERCSYCQKPEPKEAIKYSCRYNYYGDCLSKERQKHYDEHEICGYSMDVQQKCRFYAGAEKPEGEQENRCYTLKEKCPRNYDIADSTCNEEDCLNRTGQERGR